MNETIDTIRDWQTKTFGEAESAEVILARALKEVAGLASAMANGDPVAGEAADVFIVLCAYNYNRQSPNLLMGTLLRFMARVYEGQPFDHGVHHHAQEILSQLVVGQAPSIGAAVNAKMAVNRARKWRITGPGIGQHVKSAGDSQYAEDAARAWQAERDDLRDQLKAKKLAYDATLANWNEACKMAKRADDERDGLHAKINALAQELEDARQKLAYQADGLRRWPELHEQACDERDAALAKLEAMTKERDDLRAKLAMVEAERDAARAERDEIASDRDAWKETCATAIRREQGTSKFESATLRRELEKVVQERDAVERALSEAKRDHRQMAAERDNAVQLRSNAEADRDVARTELAARIRERDEARERSDRMEAERDALRVDAKRRNRENDLLEKALKERDDLREVLADERDISRKYQRERDTLRAALAERDEADAESVRAIERMSEDLSSLREEVRRMQWATVCIWYCRPAVAGERVSAALEGHGAPTSLGYLARRRQEVGGWMATHVAEAFAPEEARRG